MNGASIITLLKRIALTAALCVCFALTGGQRGMAAEQVLGESDEVDAAIAAQQKVRDDLEEKIRQYNETAKNKTREAKGLLGRITNLRQESEAAQQQIKILELQEKKLQKATTELTWEIAEASRSVNDLLQELRARVLNMYKYGTREELNLLFSVENTHDAVSSAYLLNRLSRHDQILIEDLAVRIDRLEQSKIDLEKNRELLTKQNSELDAQRAKNNASIKEINAALAGVQKERGRAESAAEEMEQAQQEVGRTILALMQRKQGRESASGPVNAGVGGNITPSVQNLPSPSVPAPTLGRGSLLEWPIRGPIASPYGSRVHPFFKTKSFNSGIDIGSSSGAAVRAAGPGEVLFVGWLRGFGQVVIIDHGSNLSTVYAHLASTGVRESEAVHTGAVIGTVGNTGADAGYSLHFEVRLGDAAKNPLDYLKKT